MENKQIWKYDVHDGSIRMPKGAKILSVQLQNNRPNIWAIVDPKAEMVSRLFVIVGTGEPFDDTDMSYVGTYQQPPFVWHLFEWKDKQQENG